MLRRLQRQTFGNTLPRLVHPGSLEPGDLIEFEHPESGGVTLVYKGRVRNRGEHGQNFYWKTNEGSTLVKWLNTDTKVRVQLFEREPVAQPLLEMELF